MTTQVKDPEPATATLPAIVAQPEPAAETAAAPEKRKFTVAEYYRMAEVGILRPEERVELIEGGGFGYGTAGTAARRGCDSFYRGFFLEA